MEEGGVVGKVLPFVFRQIDFVIDRTDPASRFAGAAIHALIRIDVQRPCTFIDAVNRALLDTGLVHHIHARFADHIGHAVEVSGVWVSS